MDKDFFKSLTNGVGCGVGVSIGIEACKNGVGFFESSFNTIARAANFINSIADNIKGK